MVSGQASQTAPVGTATGVGTAFVTCDDQLHHDGVTVSTTAFTGWQTGPATAAVSLLDPSSGLIADSGTITIVAP
jgi:hypothetical protein